MSSGSRQSGTGEVALLSAAQLMPLVGIAHEQGAWVVHSTKETAEEAECTCLGEEKHRETVLCAVLKCQGQSHSWL